VKKPKPVNTPIDAKRFRNWIAAFASYRSTVTQLLIEGWLEQFEEDDKDLGARILDSVMFFEHGSIASNFRSILSSMDGWNIDSKKRKGRWFFVAMSGSAGESGDLMLGQFRRANSLNHKTYDELFIHRSDLVRQALTSDDKVFLIDDFTGTGEQVCSVWNDPALAYSELTAGAGSVYFVVIAATAVAKKKISAETSLELVAAHSLSEKDNFFSDKCPHFQKKEKDKILKYSTIADKKNPKGYGDSGLLVVFNHGCPNNSIPILHVDNKKWTGLFPRQH
jgi:hypothetical protein